MRAVFHENPKFGDENNVTQQIRSLDEQIDSFQEEIRRLEVRRNESKTKIFCRRLSFSLTSLTSNDRSTANIRHD